MKRSTVLFAVLLVVVAAVAGGVTYYLVQEFLLARAVPFPGERALAILQDDPFSELVVEVDWAEGQAPSQAALTVLVERLETYTLKERVEVVQEQIVVNGTSFTPQDLFDVERAHRDFHPGGATFSLYFLYVDGELAESDRALGATYAGSSVGVFKDVIRRAARSGSGLTVDDVESSVLIHELGHLLGLVNLVYDSELDYEDPDRPFHSTNQSDVMYWAIEVTTMFPTAPPTDFGFETSYDLERLREGAYETFPSRLREPASTSLPAVGFLAVTVRASDRMSNRVGPP